MRIIAGKGRSLPLKTPSGKDTRPTTDRIKETLFNMISPKLFGARFLDLFAGSGSIGLEAISRGASHAVFIENNRDAVQCIKDNIEFTKFSDNCTLIPSDVISGLSKIDGELPFDIIFMDPPYDKLYEKAVLTFLKDSSLIHEETLIIIEVSDKTDLSYLNELGFVLTKEKRYKTNAHVFVMKE